MATSQGLAILDVSASASHLNFTDEENGLAAGGAMVGSKSGDCCG
jgi:hypothetical protein